MQNGFAVVIGKRGVTTSVQVEEKTINGYICAPLDGSDEMYVKEKSLLLWLNVTNLYLIKFRIQN